jgi:hypothetical protein
MNCGSFLSFLAVPERCPIGNQRREGGSVTKVGLPIPGKNIQRI